jgi:hypothetical protein
VAWRDKAGGTRDGEISHTLSDGRRANRRHGCRDLGMVSVIETRDRPDDRPLLRLGEFREYR